MIVIGLLLLIVAAAFGIDFIWKNNIHISNPTVFGERLGIHSAASLFVIGAITGAAVLLGAALLLWGLQREGAHAVSRRHDRTERRRLREDREDKSRPESSQPGEPRSSESVQPHAAPNQNATDAAPAATTVNDERSTGMTHSDEAQGT